MIVYKLILVQSIEWEGEVLYEISKNEDVNFALEERDNLNKMIELDKRILIDFIESKFCNENEYWFYVEVGNE